MTNAPHVPTRKTTDAVISPESWRPVSAWLKQHRRSPEAPGLMIDDEALPGVNQLLRKSRQAPSEDLRLRLAHDDMEALAGQCRFWESCMDELRPRFRQNAPGEECFQEMALDIEAALRESFTRPRPPGPPPRCQNCGRPVRGGGRAAVDLVDGVAVATFRHREGDPECKQQTGRL